MIAARLRLCTAFGVALVGFVLWSSTAVAQTSSVATAPAGAGQGEVKAAPVALGVYQVQAAPEVTGGMGAVIVAVQLPADTKLPAMVKIPVPTGSTPTWAGEILGGDPTADPERPYRTVQGTGGQVLEMTLEETRSAQAEFELPSATSSGGKVTMTVNWVQASPSTQTQFSVRTPPGATQVQITPTPVGEPATNVLGESLYALPDQQMKPGDTSGITVSFVSSSQSQQGQVAGASTGSSVLWFLGAALLVVVAALVFSLVSRGRRSA